MTAFRKPVQVPYRADGDRTLGSHLDWLDEPTELNSVSMALSDIHWFLSMLAGESDGCFAYGAAANPGVNVGLVEEVGTPSMSVTIEEFAGFANGIPFRVAPGVTTAAMTAPSVNPRIDAVIAAGVDREFQIIVGSEAPSPSAPSVSTADGEVLLAWIHHVVGETAIYNAEITGEGWIEDKRTRINF